MGFFSWGQSTNGSTNGTAWPHQAGYSSPGAIPGPARGMLSRLRQVTAGWLGPRLSQISPVGRILRDEKAASGPRGIFDLPWFLPYYDNYTQETTAMRLAYRQMWADPNVKSACAGKIFAVAGLKLKFQPANKKDPEAKKHAEFCDYVFNERLKGGLPQLAWAILSGACTDGYSVAEKVWGVEDRGRWRGKWVVRDLKPKDTTMDMVLQTDPWYNVTGILGLRYNAGLEFAPEDFVIFRHLPLYDQPTGMSDFRAVYSRYWMLDTCLKLRAVGLEKRAYPFLLGTWKVPSSQSALEKALAVAKWQNWASAPEDAKLQAINLAGEGDKIFAEAIKDLKHDIYLGIRYAMLQALEGSVGSERGSSQVHKETSEIAERYLAQLLVALFNDRESGLIKDLCDLNFNCEEYPKATLSDVDLNEIQTEAAIDTAIHTFLPLSKEEAYERYNRTPPKSAEDTIAPASASGAGMGDVRGMGTGAGSLASSQSADRAGIGESESSVADRFRSYLDLGPKDTFADLNLTTAQPKLIAAREAMTQKYHELYERYGQDVAASVLQAAGDLTRGQAEKPAAPVQINLPEPKQQPLEITLQVPPQETPIVHNEINVPKQEQPIVNVHQPAPIVNAEIHTPPAPERFAEKDNKVEQALLSAIRELPEAIAEAVAARPVPEPPKKLRIKRDKDGFIEEVYRE